MIRVTRHGKVLHIETNNGEMWIPEEFVRDSKCRLEMRILYDLADYLEKPPAAAAVYDSPMAKMAAALRTKAADEQADFNRRVQSGEWGPMLDAGTQADFCKNCDGSGWDGQSRETVCPTCSGGGIAARQPVGHGWSGWATQKPGSMPKLWGTREIAELNHDLTGDSRLIFLSEQPALTLIDASPKGGSDAFTVEGTVVFKRSEGAGKHCLCCPDSPSHIYTRYVEWEGKRRPDWNALELAILERVLYVNGNDGKRVRVNVDVLQPTDHGAGEN